MAAAKPYEALRSVQGMIQTLPRNQRRQIMEEALKVRRIGRNPIGRLAIQLVHLEMLASADEPPAVVENPPQES